MREGLQGVGGGGEGRMREDGIPRARRAPLAAPPPPPGGAPAAATGAACAPGDDGVAAGRRRAAAGCLRDGGRL